MSSFVTSSTEIAPLNLLLLEDDPGEQELVKEYLSDKAGLFNMAVVDNLAGALQHLSANPVDIVLSDLFLPDSRGLDTFVQLRKAWPNMPIVILSGLDDETSALDSVRQGAQDYLVKGQIDSKRLTRVLMYAVKRHELMKDEVSGELIDIPTGLHNRRGFFTLAEQTARVSKRSGKIAYICLVILKNHAWIKDKYGDNEARHAVSTTSEILKESFRTSDLIGRIGEEDFAVLTTEDGTYNPKTVSARIRKNQKFHESQFNRYPLTLSICHLRIDPSRTLTIEELETKSNQLISDYRSRQVGDESLIHN